MVIGIGETILDIIFRNDQPQAAVPGGSTFNAIISLGRVGVPATIVTETGDDHVGDLIVRYLVENGVDASYVSRNKGTKSHVSLAFLDENNDAQYQFYKDHAHACIADKMPQMTADDVVLFGSFFAVNPVIRERVVAMLRKANSAGVFMYYDVNFRPSHIAEIPMIMDNINENMSMASVVRGSLDDFRYLYGTDDVDVIYEKHILPYCPYFICTNGAEPIELRTPTLRLSFPARQVKTVSTVGAGDNFNAGFIYGLMALSPTLILPEGRRELKGFVSEQWAQLIAYGQMFSSDVCQSLGNSVTEAVVSKLIES